MSEMVKKAIASPAVGDDPLVYVMSDETVDRVGDVIKADGWRLQNFLKNPIALFGHDHKFIVGYWTDVRVRGKQLVGRLNLLPKGISERLDEIRAAVEAGVLRAVSVGFGIPDPDGIEPRKEGGWLYKSTELLECSLVSVPANPNALQVAKSLDLSDEARALIFTDSVEADPEIPEAPTDEGATAKQVRVVKLDAPARDRAKKPFVLRKIVRT